MSEPRISRLNVPEEQTLPEDIQALFAKNREKPGFVPNVYRAYSLRPQQLRGFIARSDGCASFWRRNCGETPDLVIWSFGYLVKFG